MRKRDNEQGFILVLSLLILLVLSLIGMAALSTTTYHASISGTREYLNMPSTVPRRASMNLLAGSEKGQGRR